MVAMFQRSGGKPLFGICLLLHLCLVDVAADGGASDHDYCIVGAGPSGLQLAYFLQMEHRDYIVFEKDSIPGSFFTEYPRHDTLISINKRHTGRTNSEFNLRHDWNSLISNHHSPLSNQSICKYNPTDPLLFQQYSKELFPPRVAMLHYLSNYKDKYDLNVKFDTEISNIRPEETDRKDDAHKQSQTFSMSDQRGKHYLCRTVIMANGVSQPNIPEFEGVELTEGYESISTDPDDFEGQNVLILGRGNAAFEVANSIYGSTNYVHMLSRTRIRLSWATHYVGDLRAVNNALLDTYQLKSLDGIVEVPVEALTLTRTPRNLIRASAFADTYGAIELDDEEGTREDEFELDNFPFKREYHRVIRCLGFNYDLSPFHECCTPRMGRGRAKKYPSIEHNYESTSIPGLYFAGTNTHSLDARKSAGGFIHGFRYTTRALSRLLAWTKHKQAWPSITLPVSHLTNHIVKRINEASGTYQMFSVLTDVVVFRDDMSTFEYFEEFPAQLLAQFESSTGKSATSVLVVVMEYGKNASKPGTDAFREDRARGDAEDAHLSNFLHPVLYYYPILPSTQDMDNCQKECVLPQPKAIHHMVEDFLTDWTAPATHILPLRRFVEHILSQDLRRPHGNECFIMALTHEELPWNCKGKSWWLPSASMLEDNDLLGYDNI